MKQVIARSLAFGLVLSLAPFSLSAQSGLNQSQSDGQAQLGGQREAMRMVPATAALLTTIDAKKSQVGQTFKAKLEKTVHLDNGPELPSGTLLIGSVEKDDMQQGGLSQLAIRLTTATLKDGTSVPIKATIVGLQHQQNGIYEGSPEESSDQIPNSWTNNTLAVDQIGVMSGTDLHSRIASRNSGVFVSTKKDNVVLHTGNQLQLAIAARHGDNGDTGNHASNAGAANTM